MPPRAEVYARIGRRLAAMVEAGALDELAALRALGLAPELPLMKAVAVRELLGHLEGRLDLASALDRATMQTRRYAKRQLTWLRHQLPELTPVARFGDAADDHGRAGDRGDRARLLTDAASTHTVPFRCRWRAAQYAAPRTRSCDLNNDIEGRSRSLMMPDTIDCNPRRRSDAADDRL